MNILIKIFVFLFRYLIAFSLPFFILIRGAIYFYLEQKLNTWLSLGISLSATFVILMTYTMILHLKLRGGFKENQRSLVLKSIFILVVLLAYCTYTLAFFSRSNAKTQQVRTEFSSLHPFLRLGIGTVIFLDADLLVTDFSRKRTDYRRMGLRIKNNSMHYIQKDGYAHAFDLRTNGRSELRNTLLESYFKVMGFGTLRHVGTADHLHISIPTHQNPKAL